MSNTAAEGTPNWLPGFVQVDGDWSNTVIHKLHSLFIRDFKSNKLKYKNIPIWIDSKIEINDKNNYEKIFWHLIEREVEHNNEKERYPDFSRARRIEWSGAIIRNSGTKKEILDWFNKEGRRIVLYLWLKEFDFVVIFNIAKLRFGPVAFLKTAFITDRAYQRKKLQKKFSKRLTETEKPSWLTA